MGKYENELFKTANKLRGKIPPSDYKFYVLPLVYIRYMSEKNQDTKWEEIIKKSNEEKIALLLDTELINILPQLLQLRY